MDLKRLKLEITGLVSSHVIFMLLLSPITLQRLLSTMIYFLYLHMDSEEKLWVIFCLVC